MYKSIILLQPISKKIILTKFAKLFNHKLKQTQALFGLEFIPTHLLFLMQHVKSSEFHKAIEGSHKNSRCNLQTACTWWLKTW